MTPSPQNIRIRKDQSVVEIVWNGGRTQLFPFRFLRIHCPCAACVNEFTGERILDPNTVPTDVNPSTVEFAGNYALKVGWSDGHHSGIYTWEHFSRLGAHPEVETTAG
jgi:DUF971 family protein